MKNNVLYVGIYTKTTKTKTFFKVSFKLPAPVKNNSSILSSY